VRTLALAISCLCISVSAAAQPSRSAGRLPREGRVEVSGGLRLSASSDLGSLPARELAPGGRTSTVFTSESSLDGAAGIEARLGIMLTRVLQVEGNFSFMPTGISTRLANDVDSAASTTATTPLTQLEIDGGVLAHLGRRRAGALAPFLTAGAGYVRSVYDGRTLIESGRAYYVGGGIYFAWKATGAGAVKGVGLRADVRASLLQKGAVLDAGVHLSPVAGIGLFVMF
jgi:opacity protein-like surface antigen